MKKLVNIVILCVSVFMFSISYAENIKVGQIVPDFSLESTSGEKVSLKEFKGKVIFLNFFATWCGPCKQETPGFTKVYPSYKDKNVKFISVTLEETKDKVKEFIDKYKIQWPVLLDTDSKVGSLYNIRAFPTNIVINKEGQITFMGYFLTEDVLKKELDKVLNK